MLLLSDTRIVDTLQHPVAPSFTVPEEGMPLVYVRGADNITYVKPCDGTANETLNFAGVSYTRQAPPNMLPRIETFILTGTSTSLDSIVLTRAPIIDSNGKYQVRVTVGSLVFSYGSVALPLSSQMADTSTANDNKYYNSTPGFGIPPALLIPATDANLSLLGSTVTVQYLFLPTIDEARSYTGDAPLGGLPQNAYGTVGLLKRAVVATSCFDPNADWTTAIHVGLGAVTYTNGNGASVKAPVFVPVATPTTATALLPTLQNVILLQAPNSENSFLKLSINV